VDAVALLGGADPEGVEGLQPGVSSVDQAASILLSWRTMSLPHTIKSGGPVAQRAPTKPAAIRPFDLFVTRIWQTRLAAPADELAGWAAGAEALRAASPIPAGRTNRGGWNSTDMAVLRQPIFAKLEKAIGAGCEFALGEMGHPGAVFDLQSWINTHDHGGFNFLHMHDGALLSGSYYLAVPEGSGDLVFRDPRPGVLNSFAKGGVANGCAEVHLKPEPGLLVIFPHWLEHYVEPHHGDAPRIAIAFNALRTSGTAGPNGPTSLATL